MTVTGTDMSQVTPAELASFTRQLGAMLDAGVNVLRALRIAAQHTGSPQLIEAARNVARRLEDGREFHAAIAPHPELFDSFYVEMARQGEADGHLGKALLSVADYLDRVSQKASQLSDPAGVPGNPLPLFATIMGVLGVQAVGAAVIWSIATLQPERLPLQWLGPLAAFWAGVCLLSGAWILGRLRQGPRQARQVNSDKPAPLPPKSPERKEAETEGVVRNALMEQQEEQEEEGLHAVRYRPPDALPPQHTNGKTLHPEPKPLDPDPADPFGPDSDPPRFQL